MGTSDHFDFDVCIFSDECWDRTREVGCIEVLPCVKSSRLAISVSWLSGGIQGKNNDMAQCNMVAIKIPNALENSLHVIVATWFLCEKPGRIISQPWPFWFILQVQVRYGGYGSMAKVLHIPLHHECTNGIEDNFPDAKDALPILCDICNLCRGQCHYRCSTRAHVSSGAKIQEWLVLTLAFPCDCWIPKWISFSRIFQGPSIFSWISHIFLGGRWLYIVYCKKRHVPYTNIPWPTICQQVCSWTRPLRRIRLTRTYLG